MSKQAWREHHLRTSPTLLGSGETRSNDSNLEHSAAKLNCQKKSVCVEEKSLNLYKTPAKCRHLTFRELGCDYHTVKTRQKLIKAPESDKCRRRGRAMNSRRGQ